MLLRILRGFLLSRLPAHSVARLQSAGRVSRYAGLSAPHGTHAPPLPLPPQDWERSGSDLWGSRGTGLAGFCMAFMAVMNFKNTVVGAGGLGSSFWGGAAAADEGAAGPLWQPPRRRSCACAGAAVCGRGGGRA